MDQKRQKMRALRLFLPLLFLPGLLRAQVLPDQIWLHGTNELPGQPGYGNAYLKFEGGQVSVVPSDLRMNFESTMAVMLDTLGNILFYTNGCHIANALGDTMQNGAGINPGEMHDWTCPSSGYVAPLGAMILQLPKKPNLYYLFHMGVRYSPERRLSYGPFYYTVIDMSLDGGKGGVVSKNTVAAEGNFEPFAALRHGNGRDWWLVFPEYGTNKYRKFLFSAADLQEMPAQAIGQALACRYIGSSAFSPNGARYARQQHCGAVVLDFDRCSGQFSNEHFMPLPPKAFGGGGVAFSKDGDRLLVSTQLSVQTADLSQPAPYLDTIVGTIDIVGSSLHLMQYAPDGKIYLSNLGRGKFYHAINSPNEPAIGFQQRGLELENFAVRTLPNYPNYRLYDVPGSVCDSVGVNTPSSAPELESGKRRLYPNPTSGWVNIPNPEGRERLVQVFDLVGTLVQEFMGSDTQIDLSHLNNGAYFLRIRYAGTGQTETAKLLISR